jgi:hypothetical protein
MTAAPRKVLRRTLTVFLVLLVLTGWLYLAVGDRWKSNVAFFALDEGANYRLRLTGAFGSQCAKLEHETFADPYNNWVEAGRDCAWPRVAAGDGWLAGGGVEQVITRKGGSRLPDVILFGLVPAAAASVEITLAGGAPFRIPTEAAGDGPNGFYARHLPGAGERVEVVSVRLRDANGGELRVY